MASGLLVRANRNRYGEIVAVAPNGMDWKHVYFQVFRLACGDVHSSTSAENEIVLVFIEGTADVTSTRGGWERVGSRKTPFEAPPEAIYLPPQTGYEIRARTPCEVAVCGALSRDGVHPARHIVLREQDARTRGTGQAARRIYDIVMDPESASALFVTEVLTPPGNWSSYPPHKHDVDNPPYESQLEEIYYYRAKPEAGFAFQRIYTAEGDLDVTVTAHDRDVVLVPRGYHVCAAAAEYGIYYLNVLAGPVHVYRITFDPDHAWVKEGWTW
jgi:5-deoxy-glucuronate isomerase